MQNSGRFGGHPDKAEESFRKVRSPCGARPFVGDDPDFRARHGLAEQPFRKGGTAWTAEPREPDHEVARGRGEDEFGPVKFRVGRYQKRNGRFSPHSKFNISSVKQARQVVEILQAWIDEYGADE